MPYSDFLALIKEFLKKQVLNQTVFYGILIKYFLPLTFFISSWISIKAVTNSQQKRL